MKSIYLPTSLLIVAMLPTLASADQTTGAVALSFGTVTTDGIDVQTLGIDGRINVVTDAGFSFGARHNRIDGSSSGEDGTITGSVTGASVGYSVGARIGAGIYVESANLTSDFVGDIGTLTSYGVTLGLPVGPARVDGFYGRSKISSSEDAPKIEDFGLSATYEVDQKLVIGGNYINMRASNGGESSNFRILGVAGSYAFNDEWTAFGGIARSTFEGVDLSLTTTGIGISYDTTSKTQFASVISLEYSRSTGATEGLSGDLDSIRLGLTIPFGAKATNVPDGSVAGSVLRPSHNALSSLVLGAF